MSSTVIYRPFMEILGGYPVTDYVGNGGELFYDPQSLTLRISDGETPGGQPLSMGQHRYCGTFYDTTTQINTVANQENLLKYNTTDISDGVSIVSNTRIKIQHTGKYNIQFSCQLDKTDSGTDDIDIWLKKNGTNVDWTDTRITLSGNNAKNVAAWNFVVDAVDNDYYEIAWSSSDADLRILAQNASTSPTRPGIPSIILTVTQI